MDISGDNIVIYVDYVDEFEECMDNQKKVLKLFDYIRQVCSLRQQLIRNIKDQEWTLFFD